jgi:hypothetical protein
MISKTRDIDYTSVRSKIDELCVSNLFFKNNIVQLMKSIVPEFISNNSDFSKFDKLKSVKTDTVKII